MEKSIEVLHKTRASLLSLVGTLSIDDLNKIPPGFNNNIIWNLGHVVAAQQGLCYARGGLPMLVTDEFFATYKPGSQPTANATNEQVAEIKELLSSTLSRFEQDLAANVFAANPPWQSRFGVETTTINEMIFFLLYHDGLHHGYVMALKRALGV